MRAFRAWRAEVDRGALGEYFQFGYISAPRSIYRQVCKLCPGHWLELGETGEPVTRCYWSTLEPREPLAGSESELEQQLEAMFIDAFRYRMVADVPVGVFLSGGLDSSLVTAILQRHSGQTCAPLPSASPTRRFDESRWARRVAAHVGTRHTEHILSPAEMVGILTRWADLFDEPFGDSSGVPTFLVSCVARESVKVALSADGGDELFSGYQHYGVMLARERMLARMPRPARNALSQTLQLLPERSLQGLVDRLPAPAALRHAARRDGRRPAGEAARRCFPKPTRQLLYDLGDVVLDSRGDRRNCWADRVCRGPC